MTLFDSGIRPAIDAYLEEKSKEIRDYGDYWSASSAGYCMRKLIFERLGVPPVKKEGDERKTRVFEAGHVFHAWVQEITQQAGLSVAQELELQDEDLMVRGHIDDLVLVDTGMLEGGRRYEGNKVTELEKTPIKHLILYDYKTQHANAFTWQKGRPVSYYHEMQVGTYMYMLRNAMLPVGASKILVDAIKEAVGSGQITGLQEARILKISKDDLRMDENQILWSPELKIKVLKYWSDLNVYWANRKIPPCTCADHENGFLAKEAYNPYFYNGKPCSIELYNKFKEKETI